MFSIRISSDSYQRLSEELNNCVAEANKFMFKTLRELSTKFESGKYHLKNDKMLKDYKASIEEKHNAEVESISKIIEK